MLCDHVLTCIAQKRNFEKEVARRLEDSWGDRSKQMWTFTSIIEHFIYYFACLKWRNCVPNKWTAFREFAKIIWAVHLQYGHITHENRPTPILVIPPNFVMNDLLFRKRHAFVMHVPHKQCSSSYDLPNNMFVWSSWMMRMLKHVQMHSISHMEPKVQLFFWHLEPENAWFDNEAIIHMQRFNTQSVRKKIVHS